MLQSERTMHDEGGEPQVLTVQPVHYRLYNFLTIALACGILFTFLGGLFGVSTTLSTFVTLFEGMNLSLPLPTKIMIMMMKPGLGSFLLIAMLAGLFVLLTFLVVFLFNKARRDFLAALMVQMILFLCLQFGVVMVFSLVIMALFLPLYQLMGNLH